MNLLDLITNLVDPHRQGAVFLDQGVDTTSNHLSVYMRGATGVETDIALLGVEETDEERDYYQDGAYWVNFLPLYMVEEIVEGGVAARKSPVEIATRVLEYARNDA